MSIKNMLGGYYSPSPLQTFMLNGRMNMSDDDISTAYNDIHPKSFMTPESVARERKNLADAEILTLEDLKRKNLGGGRKTNRRKNRKSKRRNTKRRRHTKKR